MRGCDVRFPKRISFRVLFACLGTAVLFGLPTGAQAATKAEQEALLQRILASPADYEAVYTYVKVSIALRDYEAAIGALERLLFFNQDLPRVKFQIGTLYYRLQSYHLAQRYFREVLATPGLDPVIRTRVEAYMPLVEKQLSPVRTWVYLTTGLRYQSNASATPDSDMIMSFGFLGPIDLSQPHGADWNAYQIGQFANDIAFGSQRQHKLETRVSGYLTEQFRLSSLNVAMANMTIGPRFSLAAHGWEGASIKPYAIASATAIGGKAPSTTAGGGIELSAPLGMNVMVTPSVEWVQAWYDTSSLLTPSYGDSNVLKAALRTAIKFSDNFQVNLKGSYRRGVADQPFESYDGYAAEVAFALRFAPPSDSMTHKWTLGPFARFSSIAFDAPNAAVDPSTARKDTTWAVGIGLDAPINAHFGLNAAFTYESTNSNIPNYSFDNWSVMFGPTARF